MARLWTSAAERSSLRHTTGGSSMRIAILLGGVAFMAAGSAVAKTPDRARIAATVAQRHDATVKALQDWIALPTIAAEKKNVSQGAEYMRKLALDAGFQ